MDAATRRPARGRIVLSLGVSTSTATVGVAVAKDGVVLASSVERTERGHAEALTPAMASVFADAGCTAADLDRIVVDVGPGRFTGMRVGLTAVRTLAHVTGVGVVPVTSLSTLAAAAGDGAEGLAVVDARRGEVFVLGLAGTAPAEPVVVTPEEAVALIGDGSVVIGDGADRYAALFAAAGADVRVGFDPDPAVLAAWAADAAVFPGVEVVPYYVREPDVQINFKVRS